MTKVGYGQNSENPMKNFLVILALLPLCATAATFELVRSKEASSIQNVCPDQIGPSSFRVETNIDNSAW